MELYWRDINIGWLALHPDIVEKGDGLLTDQVDGPTKDLCEQLLAIGGSRVFIQQGEALLSKTILTEGRLLDVPAIIIKKGKVNKAIANCFGLLEQNPVSYRMVTGWTLTDGCWFFHCWLLDGQQRVVETTVPRELYFGVILGN